MLLFSLILLIFPFLNAFSAVRPTPVISTGSYVALVTPMNNNGDIDYRKFTDLLNWHVNEGTNGLVIIGTTGEVCATRLASDLLPRYCIDLCFIMLYYAFYILIHLVMHAYYYICILIHLFTYFIATKGSMVDTYERSKLIQTAMTTVNGKIPVIVGTGTIETSKVIDLCRKLLSYSLTHSLAHLFTEIASGNAKDNGADGTLVITPYYVKPPQRALVTHYTTIADAVDIPMIVYNCPGRTGVDMKPDTVAILSKHKNIIGN